MRDVVHRYTDSGIDRPDHAKKDVRIRLLRSDHSKQRGDEGRPVQVAFNDAQRARQADVFIQADDERYVVRGDRGREHIFEPNGELEIFI